MRKERSKQWVFIVLGSLLASSGCVSIRSAGDLGCCDQELRRGYIDCSSCGPVNERGCSEHVTPLHNAAASVTSGANRLGMHMSSWKAGVHANCSEWWSKRKEKSNPPPWPKFHPIPAKPVFEPQAGQEQVSPGIFGSFGAVESD